MAFFKKTGSRRDHDGHDKKFGAQKNHLRAVQT